MRQPCLCRLLALLEVVGMASGFWQFYASRFSCFDIIPDMTFDPAEVILTLFFFFFLLGIFYLRSVLQAHVAVACVISEKGISE